MGGGEILLILVAVLVLFGADKLPEFARGLAKGLREVKKATDEIKAEITRHSNEVVGEIKDIGKQAISGADDLKNLVEDPMKKITEPPKGINKEPKSNYPG
jgi:sec-independent protein translocase protein TatA